MSQFKHVPANIVSFLRYFRYEHLPLALQQRSKPFSDLATQILEQADARIDADMADPNLVPDWAEIMVGLRNILIAKDNVVRAFLPRTD